jgi:formiminoglutamase
VRPEGMRFRIDPELLFSRGEPDDPRLGDIAKMATLAEFEKGKWDLALLGLPDDRGVLLNKGRPGAAEGPDAIRHWFYRLVPPNAKARIADLGNLQMTDNLESDHSTAAEVIAVALGHADRVAILGGGHDWGFSPISALMQGGKTGFVNLDAHLDVRPSAVQHSGTSYWRALEAGIEGENAFWHGIQKPSLAKLHEKYVEAKGGSLSLAGDEFSDEVPKAIERCDAFDVSLDLDVFAMSEAPGVSAPQPLGLPAAEVVGILRRLLAEPKVRTLGIYELSPPNDPTGSTARLAARCLWEALPQR